MPVYLEKKNPKENMYRFYAISVTPTLFGDWALICQWGRIGSRGSRLEEWFESREDALVQSLRFKARKMKRGYVGEMIFGQKSLSLSYKPTYSSHINP